MGKINVFPPKSIRLKLAAGVLPRNDIRRAPGGNSIFVSIILLTHEFSPFRGGVATYVQEIAAAATRCGIAVEVWAPDRGGPADDEKWGFPVRRLPCSGKLGAGLIGMTWALTRRRAAFANRRVVLLSVGAHMVWAALRPSAAQVTAFFHGSEIGKFERSVLWTPLVRRMYARVDGYAAASRFVAKSVRDSALINPGVPLMLVPCAIPQGLQRLARSGNPADRSELRLLTVARLHPRKGQLETARALSLLRPDLRRRLVYSVVGSGDETYRREVESACAAGGVRCEFRGAVSEEQLAVEYAGCDLYVQSSRTLARSVEGFGISYLEAAAFGRPCVGVDTGGVGEAVIDGVTGLLAPEGDLPALAACVTRLLDDPALRRKMGEAGRLHAANFNWEESARALLGAPARPTPREAPHRPG